jgi:SAM-dependent methyltransferase
VVAIDQQSTALKLLKRRVPARQRRLLTLHQAPMEGLVLPPADLIYASFSLPFCSPRELPSLWASIRRALRPRGHFAGQLFGDRDEWAGERPLNFHTIRKARALTRGFRVEMFRETEEDGQSYSGPKHWHFFDMILEKPDRDRRAPPRSPAPPAGRGRPGT